MGVEYARRLAYIVDDVVRELFRRMDAPAPRVTATVTDKSEVETMRAELEAAHAMIRKLEGDVADLRDAMDWRGGI